jgi:hypothetical protein
MRFRRYAISARLFSFPWNILRGGMSGQSGGSLYLTRDRKLRSSTGLPMKLQNADRMVLTEVGDGKASYADRHHCLSMGSSLEPCL